MNPRELERYLKSQGHSARIAKIMVAEAKRAGSVKDPGKLELCAVKIKKLFGLGK